MEDLDILFYNPDSKPDFEELKTNFNWEEIKDVETLNTEVEESENCLVITVETNSKFWKPWLKENKGINLIHLSLTKDEFFDSHHVIEWLNLEMNEIEFEFRYKKALESDQYKKSVIESDKKFKRDRKIQNEMNDRLLSVMLELKEAKEKIELLSITDALTGLGNRRQFDTDIVKELNKSARYGTDLSLFIIDIDNFKHVNDTLGHQAGDHILAKLGEIITDNLRETDWAARYGGEEFCVVVPMTSEQGALKLAERLRKSIEQKLGKEYDQTFTASIGLSKFEKALNLEAWIEQADKALYHSKDNGKNKVTYFSTQTKECCEHSSGRAQPNFKRN